MITATHGDYLIKFDSDAHKYYVRELADESADALEVPSVTTVMSLMPPWAMPWATKCLMGDIEERHPAFFETLDPDEIRYLKKAPIRTRDKAGDMGSAVHTLIHHHLTDNDSALGELWPTLDKEAQGRYETWRNWWLSGLPPARMLYTAGGNVRSEKMFFHPSLNYAGTADLICTDQEGTVWLLDWKTGKRVGEPDDTSWYQLQAYAHAAGLKNYRVALIQIMKTKVKVHDRDPKLYSRDWEIFRTFRHLWKLRKGV